MSKLILNPEHLDAASHAAKSEVRPILHTLYILPDRVVATDSYRLLEVEKTKEEHAPVMLDSGSINNARKALRKSTSFIGADIQKKRAKLLLVEQGEDRGYMADVVDGNYPTYQNIFPKDAPIAYVKVQAAYLRELAAYIEKYKENEFAGVTIELYGENKPVVFHFTTCSQNKGRAIIMPLRMSEEEKYARMPKKEEIKEAHKEIKKDSEIDIADLPF